METPLVKRPKTAIVWTCAHSSPEVPNDRFDWLGKLIEDIRPDFTVDLGDTHDLKSLNTYDDRYPKMVCAQSYENDIKHALDAEERIWDRFRKKKIKRPYRYKFQGNHEYRLDKAVKINPRLEGKTYGISPKHLKPTYYSDEYYPYAYSAPALIDIENITFGHYVSSGNYGTALSGKHHAYSLLEKLSNSCIVGHSHKLDFYRKADARPNAIQALVTGCFKGGKESWAGQANTSWSYGVSVLREIQNGDYDWQWISMNALKKEYEEYNGI